MLHILRRSLNAFKCQRIVPENTLGTLTLKTQVH